MVLQKILVPTDFSKCSLNAAHYALKLAKSINSQIKFITGYHLPYSTAEFGSVVDQSMMKLFEEEAEENFNFLRQEVPELVEWPCEYSPIMAQARDAIVSSVKTDHPDMVVMGTHGKSGAGQKLFGSITNSVIGSIGVPLLAIPSHVQYRRPSRIALGCDFRLIDDYSILDSLLILLKRFSAELHLVHVSENLGDIELTEGWEAQKLRDYFTDVGHYIHELSGESIEEALLSFTEKNQIEVLALIPRKHSLLERLISHSVTKRMALKATIPILALPG